MPTVKSAKVVMGPSKWNGTIMRAVELPDGSGRLETWAGPERGWVVGGAGWDEIVIAPRLSDEEIAALGIPAEPVEPGAAA